MKFKILLSLVALSIVAIIYTTKQSAYGDPSQTIPGVSGSPADGNTCAMAGCHTGFAVTPATGWITSNIPMGGYTPGTTYTITAIATYTSCTKFGFEISPQNLNGNLIGTLFAGTGSQLVGAGKYVTHTLAGTTGTTGSHTWTFTWKAPVAGTGSFKFYGSFNCSNSNNSTSGDHIYTSELDVVEEATPGVDCGIFSIKKPLYNDCTGSFSPIVTLANYGAVALDSVDINYNLDANTPSIYHWVGTLASQTKIDITLPSLTSSAGSHTFNATTTNPNATTDVMTNNDGKMSNYTTTLVGTTLPFFEGFESTTFPPTGWTRINPDGSTTWTRVTTAHASGIASIKMDNWTYTFMGQRDEMITPPIDLTSASNVGLTFKVAHKIYSDTYVDTLTVMISTDCGDTWNQLYKKYGSALATITTTGGSSAFTPTSTQWRQDTVNLSAYSTSTTALFRFINGNGNGNNLYLDDINILDLTTGIADINKNKPQIEIYPNPINDALTLDYTLQKNSSVSIKMYNLQGKEIQELYSEKNKNAGKHKISFDMKSYNSGMYFISIIADDKVATQKFVVAH